MKENVGILLHVTFTRAGRAASEDGRDAIRANNFLFLEYPSRPNEFFVLTPSPGYGDLREMSADLNDNARGAGTYVVRPLNDDDRRNHLRKDPILHR